MDKLQSIFRNKKADFLKLIDFGFEESNGMYTYTKALAQSGFGLTIQISKSGEISAEVIDPAFDEPYTLHLANDAVGSFVGGVKEDYENALQEIADNCFEPDVYKCRQTKELISYVRNTYGDELEFLWKKFDDNSVWRRKDSNKWYAAVLTVSRRKLGLDSDEIAEIIDLRIAPNQMDALIDRKKYFPGWHMNKKSWYTIILDGSVSTEEICRRIDESYKLAAK